MLMDSGSYTRKIRKKSKESRMKILSIALPFFCLFTSLSACEIESWASHYIQGLKYAQEKDYEHAVEQFSAGIDEVADSADILENEFVGFYLERAACYLHLKQFDNVVEDMTMVLAEYKLSHRDLETAYLNRGIAYGNLEMWDEMEKDITLYKKISGESTVLDLPNFTIMRNVKNAKSMHKAIAEGLFSCGITSSITDVQLFGEETLVIKKKICSCMHQKGCCGGVHDDIFNPANQPRQPGGGQQQHNVENCKSWCKYYVGLGITWIDNRFPRASWCWGVGMAIMGALSDTCNYCCDGGNFYDRCVRPFDDFCRQMDQFQCDVDCRGWQEQKI